MTSMVAIDLKFFVPIKFSTSERTIQTRSLYKKVSQRKIPAGMVNGRARIMMLISGEKNVSAISCAPLQIGYMDSECDLQCVVPDPSALLGLIAILFLVVILLLLVGLRRQNRILKTLHEQGQNNATVCRLAKEIDEIDRTIRQLKAKQEKETTVDQPKMNIFDPRYCTTVRGKKTNNNIRRRSGIPRSTTFPRSDQNNDLDDDDFRSEFNIPFPRDDPNA